MAITGKNAARRKREVNIYYMRCLLFLSTFQIIKNILCASKDFKYEHIYADFQNYIPIDTGE